MTASPETAAVEVDEAAAAALGRSLATGLREAALKADRDPSCVRGLFDLDAFRFLNRTGIPAEYADGPPLDGLRQGFFDHCLERVIVLEELGCGDAGLMLAAPGSNLAGGVVRDMGDAEQRERFYCALLAEPSWTFFALTEPQVGSNASAMQTKVADGALTGAKCYIGNAARANTGVVFARNRPGPLGVGAYLIETDRPGYHATPLETLGLRPLQLARIDFDAMPVAEHDVLGRHLRSGQRGMWGALRVFNGFRPGVAALALGVARAAWEYVAAERRTRPAEWETFRQAIIGTRALIHSAARIVEADPDNGVPASVAKARAARLAEQITRASLRALGPNARTDHPLLEKWARDARAFEFMEGTGNMMGLTVAQGFLTGRLDVAG
jgi:alkylation response protein AidB-like acyl-CoA dehydrogenase